MSSLSPEQSGGAPGSSDQDRSGLNIGFLKSLTDRKTTRDGNTPKRRGPKPDSKPALTRRQELNRQAQRTHRERKELYVKALEDEVLRLKEIFSNISQDKEKIAEENRQLKQLLAQNGISMGSVSGQEDSLSNLSAGYTSSASPSGYSHAQGSRTAFTPPLTSQSSAPSGSPSYLPVSQGSSQGMSGQRTAHGQPQVAKPGVDFEQAGIDFVLTLEKPCMDHMPWLLERSSEVGEDPCGHALMASCPPEPFPELTPEIPFGYSFVNGDIKSSQRTWELSKGDLGTLLDLSKKLNLDGEITPVMAWGMVMAHPRFLQLGYEDFRKLTDELSGKVRCYGFGAVMEEFEVRDAMENVLGAQEPGMVVY